MAVYGTQIQDQLKRLASRAKGLRAEEFDSKLDRIRTRAATSLTEKAIKDLVDDSGVNNRGREGKIESLFSDLK